MYVTYDGETLEVYATDSLMVDDNATFLMDVPKAATTPSTTSSWGPKRDALSIVVPVTVVYALIFLLGVVGNISTCVVIARNKHMHTATNYYLFSLAVSDLLLLISGLPPEMYSIWSRYPYVFGEPFCVLQGFAAETSANATVLTITAFTVERYVAICHPFQSHVVSKLSRAVKFIVAIWVLALCLAVPQAMQFGLVYETGPDGVVTNEEHAVCAIKRIVIPHSFEISSFVFFVAPMTLITALYLLIGVQLRRSSVLARRDHSGSVRLGNQVQPKKAMVVMVNEQAREECEAEDCRKNFARNAQTKATKHVVKMLVAVVVAFFICWAPFHAQRLLAVYAGEVKRPSTVMVVIFTILTYVSGILYYLSTTVNPFLYHIMSHKFREAFKDTLARYLGRRRGRRGRWHCYSVLSGRHSNNNSSTCNNSNESNASQRSASSLRYLEADIARLHGDRRPVVVSFRRPASVTSNSSTLTRETTLPDSALAAAEVHVRLEVAAMNPRAAGRKRPKPKKKMAFLNDTYRSIVRRNLRCSSLADILKARDSKIKSDFELCCTPKHSFQFDKAYRDKTPASHSFPRPEMTKSEIPTRYNFLPATADNFEDELPLYTLQKTHVEKHSGQTIADLECRESGRSFFGLPCQFAKELSTASTQTEFGITGDVEIFQEDQLRVKSSAESKMTLPKHTRDVGVSVHSPQGSIFSSVECCKHNIDHRASIDTLFTEKIFIPRSSTIPCFNSCKIRPITKSFADISKETARKQEIGTEQDTINDEVYDMNCNGDIAACNTDESSEINNHDLDERVKLISPVVLTDEADHKKRVLSDQVNNNNKCFAGIVDPLRVVNEEAKHQTTDKCPQKYLPLDFGLYPDCCLPIPVRKGIRRGVNDTNCTSETKPFEKSTGNRQRSSYPFGLTNDLRENSRNDSRRCDGSLNESCRSCMDLTEDRNTPRLLGVGHLNLLKSMCSSSPKLFMYDIPQMLPQTTEQ